MVQPQNIMMNNWDYLIVLDACRYDFFDSVYPTYLDGRLEKRKSPGSITPEWLSKSFPDTYDITYYSANPFINSIGADLGVYGDYIPTEHFAKIVDLWKKKWDENLGTVHPDAVTNVVIEDNPAPPTIVHYIQPHGPYLSLTEHLDSQFGYKSPEEIDLKKALIHKYLRRFLTEGLVQLGSWTDRDLIWNRVKQFLDWPTGPGSYAIHYGKETLRDAYEDNLRIALRSVTRLLDDLDGRVVITTDHGEFLGEAGRYNHPMGSNHPLLIHIPYFEVNDHETVEYEPYSTDTTATQDPKSRLVALGYSGK